ncbi:MAG: ferrochelatase [Proteobacteria bacterium]|nr:ferrochelatase [Pseudomonadota bacterium]
MTGLLLVNLGTPDEPETGAVRRYLRQFLSDPRVIDINPIGRFLLLNLIILPFRPKQSAQAYQKIWTERGSPLLYHSQDLAEQVAGRLGESWHVELAMRYGQPSIADALARFRAAFVDRIVLLPLFPQYASATTGSVLEEVFRQASETRNVPQLSVIEPFYGDHGFIDAFAEIGATVVESSQPDHVLFSFHGLPERQVVQSDESGSHCLASDDCCNRITEVNRNCYRAQCFATARRLAEKLDLAPDDYTVCFQSRLGRTVWIGPYTDRMIDRLARAGKKRLAVYCPAFVADCLETIEEIGIRGREQFVEAGGEEIFLIPSLNSSAAWADAIVAIIERHAEKISPGRALLEKAEA